MTDSYLARLLSTLGVASSMLAVYLLTSPGRIDMIDGQVRYDVAASWLDTGQPTLRDPVLARTGFAIQTERGTYAAYNAGASVAAMPLMLLSRSMPGHTVERDHFAFSLTGAVFGAAVVAVLVVAYGMLGFGVGASAGWAAVTGITTLWWPGSVTVFDQNQHAFFLLIAIVLAWGSGRRASPLLGILGGLAGGGTIVYQEIYALLLPLVGFAVFAPPPTWPGETTFRFRDVIDRAGLARYALFGAGCGAGLVAFLAFNYWRLGTLVAGARYEGALAYSGNAVAGLLSLTVSPGKGIVLFSPPVILALVGARGLVTRAPTLAIAVASVSTVHLLLVIQFAFFGGDWCWGPRYLLPLLPLWALAFPLATRYLRPWIVGLLVTLGFVIQLMAISLDHQRFFFEHGLHPYFWRDQWVYFEHSQLTSRIRELIVVVRDGVPAEVNRFSPTPRPHITYSPFGPPDHRLGAVWIRRFRVFWLPRPWPLWSRHVEPPQRPVELLPMLAAGGVLLGGGLALTILGLRRATDNSKPTRRDTT
jgi:hypothetical protein